MTTKEILQENQYHFPYHHLTHEDSNGFYLFRHLFWGLEHYTYINYVIEEIRKYNPESLADVGCGEGRILYEISKKTTLTKLYGFDISESAIHFAKGFTRNIEFHTHDITKQKLPVDAVNIIVSCEVIEHIEPVLVNEYISNISKSLISGGLLFLTTPTTNTPVNSKHYQHFTKESLEKILDSDFEIEEVVFLNVNNFWSKLLNKIIANRFFLSNIPSLNLWVLRKYQKESLIGDCNSGCRIYIRARKI